MRGYVGGFVAGIITGALLTFPVIIAHAAVVAFVARLVYGQGVLLSSIPPKFGDDVAIGLGIAYFVVLGVVALRSQLSEFQLALAISLPLPATWLMISFHGFRG
jgi:hypothetical protein